MNTSRQSISRWNERLGRGTLLGVLLAGLTLGGDTPAQPPPKSDPRPLPPFLESFRGRQEPAVLLQDVTFPTSTGPYRGRLARPDVSEGLPAIVLAYDEESWADGMKLNAHDLAGIGYVVLLVDLSRCRKAARAEAAFTDEAALAQLSAAVRWLRRRPDVLPNRLGAAGWGWSGGQALALAAAMPLQACVVCDSPLPDEPGLILGLRQTAVLGLFAGRDDRARRALPGFRKALATARVPHRLDVIDGVEVGFLRPQPGKEAEQRAEEAWVTLYEFLGKHVEDAAPPSADPASKPVASVADLMRAVNEPAGVRGVLSKALEQEPAGESQWKRIRSNAALIAEAGRLLEAHAPRKGSHSHWNEQARAFTATAESIVQAADQHQYAAARRGLQQLAGQCAACHSQHR